MLNDALGESLVHGWSLAGKDPPWRPMFSPLFPNSIDTQDVLITVYQDSSSQYVWHTNFHFSKVSKLE